MNQIRYKSQSHQNFISGQRKGLTKSLKQKLKRRLAIEPMIGHMKQEGKLGLCRIKGIIGDQINSVLTAAAHNLRLISEPYQEAAEAWKAKEFLDPNFTSLAPDFFAKNLSVCELNGSENRFFSVD